jgi:hypothetical protein
MLTTPVLFKPFIKPIMKLKRMGEAGSLCLTPLPVKKNSLFSSFSLTPTEPLSRIDF